MREASALEILDVLEERTLVSVGLHLLVHLTKSASRVDDERGAIPVHRALVVALIDTERPEELMLRVGEQVDREGELLAEALVRRHVVFAQPDYLDAGRVELGLGRR